MQNPQYDQLFPDSTSYNIEALSPNASSEQALGTPPIDHPATHFYHPMIFVVRLICSRQSEQLNLQLIWRMMLYIVYKD